MISSEITAFFFLGGGAAFDLSDRTGALKEEIEGYIDEWFQNKGVYASESRRRNKATAAAGGF